MRVEDRILKTVVFIGKEAGGQFTPLGTAFVGVVQEGTTSIPLLVTAAHVIDDYFKETDTIFVRLNRNSGGSERYRLSIMDFATQTKGLISRYCPFQLISQCLVARDGH